MFRFFEHKCRGEADELTQQTFLACVKGRDQFRGDSSFRTYLFTIPRHELYAHLRRLKRDERVDFGDMFSKKNMFALQVHGDSMIDAHISDGDYVVIRKQKTASDGDMVIAQTEDGEATLKYWRPERNRIRLERANTSIRPMYVKGAKVLGAVVGVFNGLLCAVLQFGPPRAMSALIFYGHPILHVSFGALGGWLGYLVWKPVPESAPPDTRQTTSPPGSIRPCERTCTSIRSRSAAASMRTFCPRKELVALSH